MNLNAKPGVGRNRQRPPKAFRSLLACGFQGIGRKLSIVLASNDSAKSPGPLSAEPMACIPNVPRHLSRWSKCSMPKIASSQGQHMG